MRGRSRLATLLVALDEQLMSHEPIEGSAFRSNRIENSDSTSLCSAVPNPCAKLSHKRRQEMSGLFQYGLPIEKRLCCLSVHHGA